MIVLLYPICFHRRTGARPDVQQRRAAQASGNSSRGEEDGHRNRRRHVGGAPVQVRAG
jgi:hypothetical protein